MRERCSEDGRAKREGESEVEEVTRLNSWQEYIRGHDFVLFFWFFLPGDPLIGRSLPRWAMTWVTPGCLRNVFYAGVMQIAHEYDGNT